MASISLEDAQAHLRAFIYQLVPGEEWVISENGEPVATLVRIGVDTNCPCKAGSARGKVRMAPDFDARLEEFREYME